MHFCQHVWYLPQPAGASGCAHAAQGQSMVTISRTQRTCPQLSFQRQAMQWDWTWLMFLLCFLSSKRRNKRTTLHLRAVTLIAWSWGYPRLLCTKPCGWGHAETGAWGCLCGTVLEDGVGWRKPVPEQITHTTSSDCPGWAILSTAPGTVRGNQLSHTQRKSKWIWCFSGVDTQWLEVMEVAELAHRLDEGLTAQTEHHPISPILSYVSVTLSHYQRARSRKLPGNSTVTPVLTDLGMWGSLNLVEVQRNFTLLWVQHIHMGHCRKERSCSSPSLAGLPAALPSSHSYWAASHWAGAICLKETPTIKYCQAVPHFRATPNPRSQEEMSQQDCPGTQLHAPSCSLPHHSWNFPSSQLSAVRYVVGVS